MLVGFFDAINEYDINKAKEIGTKLNESENVKKLLNLFDSAKRNNVPLGTCYDPDKKEIKHSDFIRAQNNKIINHKQANQQQTSQQQTSQQKANQQKANQQNANQQKPDTQKDAKNRFK